MSNLLLGVDAGNYWAKTAGVYGVDMYRTAICDWFERDFEETFGDDDMEFTIDKRKGFAGSIATKEDVFGGSGMYGETKAHEDTKVRVLLAIHRYLTKYCPNIQNVSIVTGQPITSHKDVEKQKIVEMLKGPHEFLVNNKKQFIHIENVGIAAEGCGAFWSNPLPGENHIIDCGSGTINLAVINAKRVINTSSDTLNFGVETVDRSLESIASGIIRATTKLRWKRTAKVYVCGGVANDILPFLKDHFTTAQVLQPYLKRLDGVELVSPVYANAVGNYELARLNYR